MVVRLLEPLGTQQCVCEIDEEADRHDGGEGIVEDHLDSPLKPFAGVGVAHRHREEAEAKGQHDDVQHEMLLCGAGPDAWPYSSCRVVKCHSTHLFSRREQQQNYRNPIVIVVPRRVVPANAGAHNQRCR